MRRIFKRQVACLLGLCLLLCALLSFSACKSPKWELSAVPEKRTVKAGESFVVTVTTTNVGGDYTYVGSSSGIGAAASLYCEFGGSKVFLDYDLRAISNDSEKQVIAAGQTITCPWTFYTHVLDVLGTGAEDAAPAGSYTLKLTFLGTEKIIENFIELKAE